MKNKGFVYSFLLLCILQLISSGTREIENDLLGNFPELKSQECTIDTHQNLDFSYACEQPVQLPSGSILPIKRLKGEETKSKSTDKFLKARVGSIIKTTNGYTERSYPLHNQYIPHNLTQSQLQIFII